jgi:hypothetical protein
LIAPVGYALNEGVELGIAVALPEAHDLSKSTSEAESGGLTLLAMMLLSTEIRPAKALMLTTASHGTSVRPLLGVAATAIISASAVCATVEIARSAASLRNFLVNTS